MSRERWANLGVILVALAIPLVAVLADEQFYLTLAARMAVLALAAVGLNLILGLGGLVSFGHAAFFGVGGYVAGILASHAFNMEPLAFGIAGSNQMIVVWILAVLCSGLLAFLIGLVSLRTAGAYFIMITLAFAQMIYYFAISWPAYGGEDGLSLYSRNQFPGLDSEDGLQFLLICYGLLALALFVFVRVRDSRFGAALQAARQSEVRLEAVGVEPYRIRLVAFVISGMITGLAGALYADLNRFVSPSMSAWAISGELMVLIIIGGVGRLFGPVAGAIIYVALEYYLGGITERWQFFLGLILLGVVLFARGGLIGWMGGRLKHG